MFECALDNSILFEVYGPKVTQTTPLEERILFKKLYIICIAKAYDS